MSTKRYKLLKDMPMCKSGEIFVWNDNKEQYVQEKFDREISQDGLFGTSYHFCYNVVENNSEWFSLIEDEKKEFIWTDELVLEFFRFTQGKDRDRTGYYTDLEDFKSSHQSIKEEQGGAVKIETPHGDYFSSMEVWDRLQAMPKFAPKQGAEIKCTIEKGMVIECLTDKNWDVKGERRIVKAVSIPENLVVFEKGYGILLSGLVNGLSTGRYKIVEQPEERLRWSDRNKTKDRDWEIVAYSLDGFMGIVTNIVFRKQADGNFLCYDIRVPEYHYKTISENELKKFKYEIHSVKRLSDNEVFSVGDKDENGLTITHFKIIDGNMFAHFAPSEDKDKILSALKKPKPQPTKERTEVRVIPFWYGDNIVKIEVKKEGGFGQENILRIKQAIESVLNESDLDIFDKAFPKQQIEKLTEQYKAMVNHLRKDKYTEKEAIDFLVSQNYIIEKVTPELNQAHWWHPYKFTQQQVDEIEEAAFNAGKKFTVEGYVEPVMLLFPTYQDYKKPKDPLKGTPHEKTDWDSVGRMMGKKKVFTTHDGKDIYVGDRYFYLNEQDWEYHEDTAAHYTSETFKSFSTKEAAEFYIKENKPISVSLKELASCYTNFVKQLPGGMNSESTMVCDVNKLDALFKEKQKS